MFFKKLFQKPPDTCCAEMHTESSSTDEHVQETAITNKAEPLFDQLEGCVRQLKTAWSEQETQLEQLVNDIKRERNNAEQNTAQALNAAMQSLFADCAVPVAQILNQAKLLEQGSPLDAKDVLLVSNNLIEALKSHGLVIDGVPGDRVRFDPSCHQLLDENEQIQEDQFVTVRFPATIYQGKILRKAGVEKVDQ